MVADHHPMAPDEGDNGTVAMLGFGALGGALAYLINYLITYVWKAPAVADALRGINLIASFLGVDAIPAWRGVGWLFYNAHFVRTRVPGPGSPSFVDFLAETANGWLLMVIVPIVIVVAGAAVAYRNDADVAGRAAIHGAAVGIGYLPLAAAGTLVFAQPIADTGARIAPDLLPAVLVAGLLYPIVFGGIGGALSTLTR